LNKDGDDLKARDPSGSPTSLPCNQLELPNLSIDGSDNQGLKNSKFSNRRGERLKAIVAEGFTGLKRVWSNCIDRNPPEWALA
jgi:hypothetical protein